MSVLKTLSFYHFRSYEKAALDDLSERLIVISGANGAGKTNILEAISLFSPGRGLRGAKVLDMQRQDDDTPWALSAQLFLKYGEEIRLGTGRDPTSKNGAEKRVLRVNGNTVRSQNMLSEYLACVWLTPQMDRLFLDSGRERRKFLDRLIFAFDAGHSARVNRYDNALSQRSKLLRNGQMDDSWLSGLEGQMAETAIAIAAARIDFIARLQVACENSDHAYFPLARFSVAGRVEEDLLSLPALEVEERFKAMLRESRPRDALTGGARAGPHRSDLLVTYDAKNMPADQCSTGEQKALLIGLILAHARLIKAERGAPPILLLDEVAAHLDESRRGALYQILDELEAQVWLTGTERDLFSQIQNKAQFFDVRDSQIYSG